MGIYNPYTVPLTIFFPRELAFENIREYSHMNHWNAKYSIAPSTAAIKSLQLRQHVLDNVQQAKKYIDATILDNSRISSRIFTFLREYTEKYLWAGL